MSRKILTAVVLALLAALIVSGQTNTFCANNLACTVTGAYSFSQQITSTVSTGTAPFSIASTTVVPNLNAQLHGGLIAPASAIMGISDTQTPTNKTLITASSGNNVTSLNAQANGAAVTGTGSAVTLYTYSLPGSTVASLKGFRVNFGLGTQHWKRVSDLQPAVEWRQRRAHRRFGAKWKWRMDERNGFEYGLDHRHCCMVIF